MYCTTSSKSLPAPFYSLKGCLPAGRFPFRGQGWAQATQIKTLHITYTLGLLLYTLPLQSQAPKNKLFAKGAKVELVASDFTFTEGPAVDIAGNVYFTDQPNNRIMEYSIAGNLSVFMEGAGRANGLYFDNFGNLLACADEKNELWQIARSKKVTVLLKDFEGKKFNGPNDLWVHPDGGIYFTDPYYKRPYWTDPQQEMESQDVYYLSADRKNVRRVATDLEQPNGIVGTKNGKQLYVADIKARKTYRYDIAEDGNLTNKTLFVEMGSDGMTLDNKGNLYITGKGVTVFNKRGKKIQHIPIEENWTANVCFGSHKQKTLFITAMKSLYKVDMRVKGIR